MPNGQICRPMFPPRGPPQQLPVTSTRRAETFLHPSNFFTHKTGQLLLGSTHVRYNNSYACELFKIWSIFALAAILGLLVPVLWLQLYPYQSIDITYMLSITCSTVLLLNCIMNLGITFLYFYSFTQISSLEEESVYVMYNCKNHKVK